MKLTASKASLAIVAAVVTGQLGSLAFAAEPAPVRSLLETRQDRVVVQNWDLSCGAAALATILIYQHGDQVTEREIALNMIGREEYLENPNLIKWRQGFSLLDFKRFVEARGYNGLGLGHMSYEQLLRYAPIIVPIDAYGYPHFVVFRGALEDRVLLADPAFGNRTMTRKAFEKAWLRFPDIGYVGFVVERRDKLIPPNRLAPRALEFPALR